MLARRLRRETQLAPCRDTRPALAQPHRMPAAGPTTPHPGTRNPAQDPLFVPQLMAHVGPVALADWLVHVGGLAAYSALHSTGRAGGGCQGCQPSGRSGCRALLEVGARGGARAAADRRPPPLLAARASDARACARVHVCARADAPAVACVRSRWPCQGAGRQQGRPSQSAVHAAARSGRLGVWQRRRLQAVRFPGCGEATGLRVRWGACSGWLCMQCKLRRLLRRLRVPQACRSHVCGVSCM
jgi:hypothetical protein